MGKSERKRISTKISASYLLKEHLGIIFTVEKYRKYDLHQMTRNLKISVTRMKKEEKGEEEKEGVF
jgi:hypothetical protein